MKHAARRPTDPQLRRYIHSYWELQAPPPPTGIQPVLPAKPLFDLLFSFGAPTCWRPSNAEPILLKHSFISGLRTHPVLLSPEGPVHYFGVRFLPQGLFPFLGIPLTEMVNRVIPLEMLPEPLWRRIALQLAETPDFTRRIAILEKHLLAMLNRNDPPESPVIKRASRLILARRGVLPMDTLCNITSIHPKQLDREFLKYLGMPPKLYSRIVRFNRLLREITEHRNSVNWQNLVAQLGFFDQSHLIREFKQFMGQSPEHFRKNGVSTSDVSPRSTEITPGSRPQ